MNVKPTEAATESVLEGDKDVIERNGAVSQHNKSLLTLQSPKRTEHQLLLVLEKR